MITVQASVSKGWLHRPGKLQVTDPMIIGEEKGILHILKLK